MKSERARIAYLVNFFGPAGLEVFVLNLINRLDREKFQPFLYINYWGTEEYLAKLKPDISVTQFRRQELKGTNFYRQLTEQARQDKIDILQNHNWGTFLEAAYVKFQYPRVKLIHVQQGLEYEVTMNASPWKRQLRKWVRHLLIRRFSGVVGVSTSAKDYLRKEWGAKQPRVIFNSIDTERFTGGYSSKKKKILGNQPEFRICAVGRMVPVKNFICLFRAINLLKDKIPHLKLYHVGQNLLDGRGLREELVGYVQENQLEPYIEFLGVRDDVHLVLSECDVFALTSFSEGLSLSLVEAQASGLPAVVTRVGGNPDVIQDGLNGFLVPSDDETAVAEAILKIYQNPELARQMSANARRIAQEKFDVRNMVRQYETLYEEILSR